MTSIGQLDPDTVQFRGHNLNRPECVLCTEDGSVFVSNWAGGVTRLLPNGDQYDIIAVDAPVPLRPNGIAILPDRTFLLANLGDDGGVWRLTTDGHASPFLLDVDGTTIEPANFVVPDANGRVWITVSTRHTPRSLAYRSDVSDGYIVMVDESGARIAADNLGYTNEVQIHPSGDWLYVNETFARRLSRFRIAADGTLGSRETVTEFGAGIYPDGLCFDEAMGVWIVSIVSNRVIRIAQDGSQTTVLEGGDPGHVAKVEAAYSAHRMDRSHLDSVGEARFQNVSSIAFAGSDRRIALLGCLLGDRLVSFSSPVAGIEPAHWNWCLPHPNN